MFLRLVADSFTRRPRRKLLTGAALALGMAVATAALSVALDVGDRLAQEFRSLGANLVVTPQADSLPLEIGGVDYRPANSGAYLPESDLPKLKSIFWHNNIIAFAPTLNVPIGLSSGIPLAVKEPPSIRAYRTLIGTWSSQSVALPDGGAFSTGIGKTNPWWRVEGEWFKDDAKECLVGRNLAAKLRSPVGSNIKIGDTLFVYADSSVDPYSGAHPMALRITGFLNTDGPENDAVVAPLFIAQQLARKPGEYRKLYVSALTKPEDNFARRDPKSMNTEEFERWSCTPYVSSIAYSIEETLPGSDVRVIRRVAESEGNILTHVGTLLWLVTFAALLAAALAVGASSAASVIERRSEIALMKALGAGGGSVGFLLAAEQLLLAVVGGGIGYALGIILARVVGEKIFGAAPEPSLLVFVIILGLAAGVTMLGSAIPLRRAAHFQPAPILRGE
ncbi:MAG TPA: ABC transporter permease [Bryobacteraceae bacterium]|nr:ABC transporter permease [Bryobacteraceae bacterium]